MEQNMKKEMKSLRADIKQDMKMELRDIKKSLEDVTKDMNKVKERLDKLEEKTEVMEGNIDSIKNTEQMEVERRLDEKALEDQKQRENCLKIRGVKEIKGENLYDSFLPLLADYAEISVNDLSWEVSKIYRLNSQVAKEKGWPRDIVIYFLRKRIRDQILDLSYKKVFQIDEEEAKIFKDIPKRILRKRENYKFLTTLLIKNDILYKWEKLEGISVFYKQRWHKLNSVQKAKDFWKRCNKDIRKDQEKQDNLDYKEKLRSANKPKEKPEEESFVHSEEEEPDGDPDKADNTDIEDEEAGGTNTTTSL